MRLDQRSCVAAGTKAQREDIPRARWGHGAGQIGGARLREVGRRWSTEASSFLSALAEAKTRCEPEVVRKSAMVAWLCRWSVLMACTRAFALSLFDRRCCASANGDTPTTSEVIWVWSDPRRGAFALFTLDSFSTLHHHLSQKKKRIWTRSGTQSKQQHWRTTQRIQSGADTSD